jgi:putative glycerol-1-phosphate prenyltransferase
MLIDSGAPTSASYMSQTFPIPHDKTDIAECTAMAGEMLGMSVLYLDAGSGARYPVSGKMISGVRQKTRLPLIAGGGIRSADKAIELCDAGADIIVVGNILESSPELMQEIAAGIKQYQTR